MELKMAVVVTGRERVAFSNRASLWGFKITTGSRCTGMTSDKAYNCPVKAHDAGNRMMKKLISYSK